MCGFLIDIGNYFGGEIPHNINEKLARRGPDGENTFILEEQKIFLKHWLLSMSGSETTSPQEQPIKLTKSRYLLLNGEIYNYRELSEKYELNIPVENYSDTNVLCSLIEAMGFRRAMENLKGMFSICLVDAANQEIYVATDKFGEKPLYYKKTNVGVIFSSVPLTLATPMVCDILEFISYKDTMRRAVIDRDSIIVSPGVIAKFSFTGEQIESLSAGNVHRSITFKKSKTRESDFHKVFEKIIVDVSQTKRKIGLAISGGIDSTYIAAVLSDLNKGQLQVPCYSISFSNYEQNAFEVSRAVAICKNLSLPHKLINLEDEHIITFLKELLLRLPSPSGDPALVPLAFLAKEMRKDGITACLVGDGGDELFGGYTRYRYEAIGRRVSAFVNLPRLVKMIDNKISWRSKHSKTRALLMSAHSRYSLSEYLLHNPSQFFKFRERADRLLIFPEFDEVEQASVRDWIGYLFPVLVKKTDMAGMSYGLEFRSPFLHDDILEYVLSHPECLMSNKRVMREKVDPIYSSIQTQERKLGFGVPFMRWLRGPLNAHMKLVNNSVTLGEFDITDKQINKELQVDRNFSLWAYFMLKAWIFENRAKCSVIG